MDLGPQDTNLFDVSNMRSSSLFLLSEILSFYLRMKWPLQLQFVEWKTAVITGKTYKEKLVHYLQKRLLKVGKKKKKEELELQISLTICWWFSKAIYVEA